MIILSQLLTSSRIQLLIGLDEGVGVDSGATFKASLYVHGSLSSPG